MRVLAQIWISPSSMPENFYDVLDVSSDATAEEIRAAYREKVKETHPDVNDDPGANERFKTVTRAKEVLTDERTRAAYDRQGHAQFVDEDEAWAWDDRQATASPSETTGTPREAGERDRSAATGPNAGTDASTQTDPGPSRNQSETTANRRSAPSSGIWDDTDPPGDDSGATASDGGSAYAARTTFDAETVDRLRFPQTPGKVVELLALFSLYPVLALATMFPPLPLSVNVVVGVCTLFTVGYMVSIPEVGALVFGSWGVVAPAVIVALPEVGLLSLFGLLVVVVCWVPFGLALATRAALRV